MADDTPRYRKFSDENHGVYYCPTDNAVAGRLTADDLPEGCIEADVVGRYAGNIELADHTGP